MDILLEPSELWLFCVLNRTDNYLAHRPGSWLHLKALKTLVMKMVILAGQSSWSTPAMTGKDKVKPGGISRRVGQIQNERKEGVLWLFVQLLLC